MTTVPANTQNVLREGIIELAFGEPDPALMAVGLVRQAAAAVLEDAPQAALAYGSSEGPETLRNEVARRVAAREGHECAAADVLVSGGNSQALGQVLTALTAPGTWCSSSLHPTTWRWASCATTRSRSSACGSARSVRRSPSSVPPASAPAGCGFATPAGGFFIWLTLPRGLAATALLPVAEAHGVAFAPGSRFC